MQHVLNWLRLVSPALAPMRRARQRHHAAVRLVTEPLESRLLLSVAPELHPLPDPLVQGAAMAVAPVTRAADSASLLDPGQLMTLNMPLRQERLLPFHDAADGNEAAADTVNGAGPTRVAGGLLPGSNNGGDGPQAKYVFGNDDRSPVGRNNMTTYPWATIGRTWTKWADGTEASGTAAVIGPRTLLTAGHIVYSADHGGWASQVYFSPGQDGERLQDDFWDTNFKRSDYQIYGESRATSLTTYPGWINSGDWNFDIGYVTLDRDIGDFTGWMGWGYNNDNNYFQNRLLNTAGYPGDLTPQNYDMYWTSGNIQTVNANNLQSQIDTFPGQSGSPLWNYSSADGSRVIYATNSSQWADNNGNPIFNQFTRITQSRFADMQNRVNADGDATDMPDLVDYDQWFNTDAAFYSAGVGNTLSVTAYPRNNGTAAAGSFKVSFYASTNTTITTADILLGETTISSLQPLSWATANWSGTLPSMPSGQYYIGWFIDSGNAQSEYQEFDNTGYIDQRLNVQQTNVHLDFNARNSPTAAGYVGVQPDTLFSTSTGYGWTDTKTKGFDTKSANSLLRDGHQGKAGTFRVAMPSGSTYDATLYFYSKKAYTFDVFAEGVLAVDDLSVPKESARSVRITGTVGGDGTLDFRFASKGGFVLNGLDLIGQGVNAAAPTSADAATDLAMSHASQAAEIQSLDALFAELGQNGAAVRRRR